MTAVIYARYSSDNQREESIEGQIRECTAYAEKNGITVVKHYIDRALSAKTDNRPDFQQMINVCAQRYGDGSGQPVRDVEQGARSGDGKPFQSVQRYRR